MQLESIKIGEGFLLLQDCIQKYLGKNASETFFDIKDPKSLDYVILQQIFNGGTTFCEVYVNIKEEKERF